VVVQGSETPNLDFPGSYWWNAEEPVGVGRRDQLSITTAIHPAHWSSKYDSSETQW